MLTGGRKTLGVFMNKAGVDFQNAVQYAAQKQAKALGYDVYFFFTVGYRGSDNGYDVHEKRMFSFAPVEKLDGLLITPDAYEMNGFREELFDMLEKRARCPIVCVRDSRSAYDSIYTNEADALRPLMTHLLDDHGFRRVCFQAGYKDHPDSEKRLQCYREEMAKRQIPVPENGVFYGTMWINGADKAYHHFFDDPANRPEAVVCANDHMAHALIEEILEHGLRVPEDVVVTGFDNVQKSAHSWPTLTTVGQDYDKMVTMAVDLLHSRIQARERGETLPQGEHISIDGSLEIRESCGCSMARQEAQQRDELRQINRKLQDIQQREVSQTYFDIELNSAETYEEIHKTIIRKLADTPAMRDFYLCLFEDEHGFAGDLTPRVRLVSAIKDRADMGLPALSFDQRELLPAVAERSDEPQSFFIHLLHQRDQMYGYTVMQFVEGEIPSMFYMHWNIIISIALRNLDNQFKLQALYEERRLSSITDVLTGLNNRRGLLEKLYPSWEDMCLRGQRVSFVSLDMDNLKPINDTYGHQGGDTALCMVAEALRQAAPEDAVLARVGGDEFLVFLPCCDEQGAERFKEDFHAALAKLNQQHPFSVGASVGSVAVALQPGMAAEVCINESDNRMYQEKKRRHAELESHARRLR